jgi:hypothetical protein
VRPARNPARKNRTAELAAQLVAANAELERLRADVAELRQRSCRRVAILRPKHPRAQPEMTRPPPDADGLDQCRGLMVGARLLLAAA